MGLSDREIADRLRLNRGSIQRRRVKMGLTAHGTSHEHYRRRVRRRLREQLHKEGADNLTELRRRHHSLAAVRHGWPQDCTPRQVTILELIETFGPLTRIELAELLLISPSTMDKGNTPTSKLTARGYLVRQPIHSQRQQTALCARWRYDLAPELRQKRKARNLA